MARITGVGGVFLKSRGDHVALAEWYRKHLGLTLEAFGGAILRWPDDKAEDQGLTKQQIESGEGIAQRLAEEIADSYTSGVSMSQSSGLRQKAIEVSGYAPGTEGARMMSEWVKQGSLYERQQRLSAASMVQGLADEMEFTPEQRRDMSQKVYELLSSGVSQADVSRSMQQRSMSNQYYWSQAASLASSGGADYITVSLAVLKKDIILGFDLLSDIILNPAFSGDEIQRRKTSLKNSIIQQKEDPGIVASKAFAEAVFGENPYVRPVEGTEQSLDRISREDIAAFHEENYLPDNAVMTVVGDISPGELKSLLDKYFMSWRGRGRKEISLQMPVPEKKPQVIKIQKDLAQANIILGHIGIQLQGIGSAAGLLESRTSTEPSYAQLEVATPGHFVPIEQGALQWRRASLDRSE